METLHFQGNLMACTNMVLTKGTSQEV